jgi:imidazolonepropionase-like amidohydrolase
LDNLSRFVKEGGMVALGTDFSGYIFDFESGMPMTEIFLMKKAGMTPMEIIVAATKHAAFVCSLGDQIGTLEPGKIADILVVNSNPLDDLNALKDVRVVIRNGEIIRWEPSEGTK